MSILPHTPALSCLPLIRQPCSLGIRVTALLIRKVRWVILACRYHLLHKLELDLPLDHSVGILRFLLSSMRAAKRRLMGSWYQWKLTVRLHPIVVNRKASRFCWDLWGVEPCAEHEEHEDESEDNTELNLATMLAPSVCQNSIRSLCRHLTSCQRCRTARK